MSEADRYVRIPIAETHCGVGIFAWQSPARVEVVKAEIDQVFALSDVEELMAFLRNVDHAPEARLLAAASIKAAFQVAAEDRRVRPNVNLALVEALVSGLDSLYWMNPDRYGSLLDRDTPLREEPIPSDELEAALAAGKAEMAAED